jgi:hypothetical protein
MVVQKGKAARFAPGRDQQPLASFWTLWAEGRDVYVSARNANANFKISVHESGQIHIRYQKGTKEKQEWAPLTRLGDGPWMHGLELRFAASEGAYRPFNETKSSTKKPAHLIDVPDGFVLYANLIITSVQTDFDQQLPSELLPAGEIFWQAKLSDGRVAALVMRVMQLDDQTRDAIKYIREELRPHAVVTKMPKGRKYLEVHSMHWSAEGGNVVVVVPMGEEAFQSEETSIPTAPLPPEYFRYHAPPSFVEVTAPDGRRVALVELDEVDKLIGLTKGVSNKVGVGTVSLRLEPKNLDPTGRPFMANPCELVCKYQLGGATPSARIHRINAKFDGTSRFSVDLVTLSTSLRNQNLSPPVGALGDGEEISTKIPFETLSLVATLDLPVTSAEIVGRFILLNRG